MLITVSADEILLPKYKYSFTKKLIIISTSQYNKCVPLEFIMFLATSVMVIVVRNGHGDTSSNPGRD